MLSRPNFARFLASLHRADFARKKWQFRRRSFRPVLTPRPRNSDLAPASIAFSRNPRLQIREPRTIGSVDDDEEVVRRDAGFLEDARETVFILARIVVVSSVVTTLIIAYLITRLTRVNLFPTALRTGIEFLGPIFIKFGQWMSTRRDVLPRDICDTLSRLQRDVTPHTWLYTERLLEATYGSSWRDLFARFDDEGLIGSGCCAQGFDWRMLLSGAAAALLAILVLATGYRPSWWSFWTRNYKANVDAGDNGRKFKTARDVPGPFALPILGTRWIYSRFGYYSLNKIHEAYIDLNRRFGSLCKEEALGNCFVVSVFARHDIEAILKRGSRYPLRPPQEVISHYRRSRTDRYTNLGLVNEQGATWQKLRAALTPELTGANTVRGFFPALNIVTDGFIDLIRKRRADFTVKGFEELAYRMGLESTCTLILGRHLGFLESDSSSTLTTRLAEAVRIHFMASRDAFYGLPLWKLLPTSAYKQLIESEDTIYNIISELVEATVLEKQNDAKDESVEAVFLSILRQKDLDMRDKKAAIVDFIAAGIHTLGNTLVFLFNLIGRNPEVQETLYKEAQYLAPPGCDITEGNLRGAKYLRACINESFRIVPTTPCIARILDEPIELEEYRLDPGTVVLLHTWIAGLNDDNFKDASQCLPERWLKPNMNPHSPLLVAPFGAGRRICPGKRFVDYALQLILAKIVREFEIVVEEELDLQFEFILAPQSPVSLGFRDRISRAEMT